MKLKVLLIGLCFMLINQCAMASRLPDNFWTYLKTQLPSSTQRFDSVVVLKNGTMYVPLYPADEVKNLKEFKIEYTYPENRSLSSEPEVVIFNNNFVLMKLIKNKDGSLGITQNENLPLKVKLGVMPQDMILPPDFKIPESMKVILGDLVIPKKAEAEITTTQDVKITNDKTVFVPLNELSNKKTLISTDKSKFVLVYNGESKTSLYELKLNGLPSEILASNKTKYALVMYFGSKTVDIIDIANEKTITQITLDDTPKDAILDTTNNTAYIASANAAKIYVVDLDSAALKRVIKLEQAPYKLAVSNKGDALAFADRNASKLYSLKKNEDGYIAKYLAKASNISGLVYKNDRIYAISRTENKLSVYNEPESVLTGEYPLNEKPVDIVSYGNKLYILCAKDSVINVFNTEKQSFEKSIELDKTGFYSKITVIPNQPNALITGIQTKQFLLLNLDKMVVTKKQNSNIDVANIVIIENRKNKEAL